MHHIQQARFFYHPAELIGCSLRFANTTEAVAKEMFRLAFRRLADIPLYDISPAHETDGSWPLNHQLLTPTPQIVLITSNANSTGEHYGGMAWVGSCWMGAIRKHGMRPLLFSSQWRVAE